MKKETVMKGDTTFTSVNYGVGESHIVTSGINGKLVFWNAHTAMCDRELQASDTSIKCSDISSDGTVIVTGGEDQLIKVWDYTKGRVIAAAKNSGKANRVRLDSEKCTIACVNADGSIFVWKLCFRDLPVMDKQV